MVTLLDSAWTSVNSKTIKEFIDSAQSIAISGHTNPDGDSIGAMLSLGLGLEALGKKVYLLCDSEIPWNYLHLPAASRVQRSLGSTVDLAIAVDCGSLDMLGASKEMLDAARTVLEIDHHASRTPFGDISYVDPHASSAGELVFNLLQELKIKITRDIAQNILTSIIVETNSFRLPGMNPHSFEVCAELLRTGVDFFKLAETVYWVTSKGSAMLMGICLRKCRFLLDGGLAWSCLTKRDYTRAGAREADGDPVLERIRSIQGVKVAVLFREKDDHQWRVSLRSKEGINVAELAEKFGGGGHASAAGCSIPKTALDDLLNQGRLLVLQGNSEEFSTAAEAKIEVPVVAFCNTIKYPADRHVHSPWTATAVLPAV